MVHLNIGTLKRISIVYLSLGHLIFFIGWLKPLYAVPAVILLLAAYFIYFRDTKTSNTIEIPTGNFVLLLASILVWVLFSGSGGFGYQYDDYYKNNALMNDLIIQKWPLTYSIGGDKHYLSHYMGYYLPAPALFGWIGWEVANLANFSFTFIGVFLAFIWFFRYLSNYSAWLVWLFLLLSGFQVFTFFYLNIDIPLSELFTDFIKNHRNLFWYNSFKLLNLTYEGNTSILYWAPQHAIPAWLGMGLLLSDWRVDKKITYAPFYLSLLAFWSPLVLIGISPYFVYALLATRFKGVFNYVNLLIAPILFLLITTYILAIDSKGFIMSNFTISANRENLSIIKQLGIYLFFFVMEVGIWWVVAFKILKTTLTVDEKKIFVFSLILLFGIPLWRYGLWNDWCTRVSLPSLALLWLMQLRAFFSMSKTLYLKKVLYVLLFIGSFDTILAFGGSSYEYLSSFRKGKIWPLPAQGIAGDVPAICKSFPVQQFVARPDTFFFKYLGKNK